MLLSLALCTLSAAPAAAPRATIAPAGFLRDARAELQAGNHLVFDAKIAWPATITRKSFVVEALAADGALLYSRPVVARARAPIGARKHSVAAHFDLELPRLEGVEQLRVRVAP